MPPICDIDTDVKPWLGIDPSVTTHDTTLTIIRDSTESAVLAYVETQFELTAVSEIIDGNKSDQIVPREYPIDSVSAVYFGVETDGSGGNLLDADRYQVRPEAIILARTYSPFGRTLIRVDYTYGFDGVPAEVKEAILLAIEAKFRRKGSKSIGRSGRSKKDESESFSSGPSNWDSRTGLPKEVVFMLNNYRRLEFPVSPMAQRNR